MNFQWAKTNAIIVDLDGTLANCDHRLHFLRKDLIDDNSKAKNKKQNWKMFFKGLKDDPVNEWCNEIINKFKNDHVILLVSGRPDTYKVETVKWLKAHKIYYNKLIMRKGNDHRNDSIVKKEIYENEIKPEFNVKFCVDDRQRVVDAWRELGLVALQCSKGDF